MIVEAKQMNGMTEHFHIIKEYVRDRHIYRAISLEGNYLSEARGNTIFDIKSEIEAIEEVKIIKEVR